ncbi:DnaA regulatory inactivator Hda [Glaciecola siphonariae]|uniref:DnaA regulatory inactivator Hda n=1 Tax=Glaciecola siphonariae TaxID=521012 RepID=A0ABV9LT29_9ALTE
MQLVLPVLQTHDFSLDNFVAGSNQGVVQHLQNSVCHSADKASGVNTSAGAAPITYLYGCSGVGKTHLLLAMHQHAEAQGFSARYVDIEQVRKLPAQLIQGLGQHDVICIDNIHLIAEDREWQIALFDTLNQFLEQNPCHCIVSAKSAVKYIEFSLADLASRLQWGTSFQLRDMEEGDKIEALRLHFSERGVSVQNELLVFLLRRCERDMHKLVELVSTLDSMSLQQHRKLTIPFVKEALGL